MKKIIILLASIFLINIAIAGGVNKDGLQLKVQSVSYDYADAFSVTAYVEVTCSKRGGYNSIHVQCDFLNKKNNVVAQGYGQLLSGLAKGEKRVARVGATLHGRDADSARCYISYTR